MARKIGKKPVGEVLGPLRTPAQRTEKGEGKRGKKVIKKACRRKGRKAKTKNCRRRGGLCGRSIGEGKKEISQKKKMRKGGEISASRPGGLQGGVIKNNGTQKEKGSGTGGGEENAERKRSRQRSAGIQPAT